MPDLPDRRSLPERLAADEPGAPTGYLLDREDRRTPCAIGLDDEHERERDKADGQREAER